MYCSWRRVRQSEVAIYIMMRQGGLKFGFASLLPLAGIVAAVERVFSVKSVAVIFMNEKWSYILRSFYLNSLTVLVACSGRHQRRFSSATVHLLIDRHAVGNYFQFSQCLLC